MNYKRKVEIMCALIVEAMVRGYIVLLSNVNVLLVKRGISMG